MKKPTLDIKLALIPLLLLGLGGVLYFQYGGGSSDAIEVTELADRKNLTGGDAAENDATVKNAVLAAVDVQTLGRFDPFARRGAIAALYPSPQPRANAVLDGGAPHLVGLESTQSTLPPSSLEALLKTDDGWTAIVGSRLVKTGDVLVTNDKRPYALVTNIDEQGVVLQPIPADRPL